MTSNACLKPRWTLPVRHGTSTMFASAVTSFQSSGWVPRNAATTKSACATT
jgi:hydroxymethylpyrimidine/phosphomethylpyrimidine kinase